MQVRNETKALVLGTAVDRADSFFKRLLGLMFRRTLAPGEGLLIQPCNAVHSHFMRFPIDVLFLDKEWKVLHRMPVMQPWRQSPIVRGAHAVLELAAGAAGETEVGDRLVLE